MAIRKLKPVTPGTRWVSVAAFTEITKTPPEKSLIEPLRKTGGRNNTGRITSRHRGGGHKRFYRVIDFKRNKTGMDAKVTAIEYDPNRSARIALLQYADGERRYIIAPEGVKVGDVLRSGADAEIRTGNAMPLANIPAGTFVHNIELRPGKGAQIARSAGMAVQLMAKEGKFAQLRMPSGEVRSCRARMHGHDRRRRQRRPREYQCRQGGPFALARHPAAVPRRRAEPCRSPARWRRRQVAPGQSPPGVTMGLAHQGEEDAQAQEGIQQVHRETKEVSA